MTELIKSVAHWRARERRGSLGFVPTMGCLHDAHCALLHRAKKENDEVVLSIFVNPTQFDEHVDFDAYPRHLDKDLERARLCGVDVVFLPTYDELYVDDYRYRVSENRLSKILEGEARPGHFDGMLTIVLKLLLLLRPARAYFGEKDYQQLRLVQGMAEAFFLETEIIGHPTVRAADGLALSSRNLRLTEAQRAQAPLFSQALLSPRSPAEIRQDLHQAGFEVDYVEDHDGRRFGAVRLDTVRLIDNVPL